MLSGYDHDQKMYGKVRSMPSLFYAVISMAMGGLISRFGYGILLPTMRDVTQTYVQEDLRNLGHSLSDAIYTSFSGVVSLMYAGAVADRFGVSAMLSLCAAIAVIPAVLSMKKLEN